jgi:hypothetical protein
MDKVKAIALLTNENTGLTYIRPDYEYILDNEEFSLDDVTDFENVSKLVVHNQLLLERDMRNAQMDKTAIVMQWLYDVITTIVEPAIVEEQNQLIKDMLEYRKERNAIDERTKELDQKQQMLEDKSNVLHMNFGMDFSKKKPQ